MVPVVHSVVDTVLPPACVLCAAPLAISPNQPTELTSLCALCHHQLISNWPPGAISCRFCGMPRPSEAVLPLDQRCITCADVEFAFDEVVVLAIYRDAVREAVVASKLARHSPLASQMGELLVSPLCARFGTPTPEVCRWPTRLTFVPTHISRRWQRCGRSGAETIARSVGTSLDMPTEPMLRLTRRVKKQAWLADADRAENVRGAFAMRKRYAYGGPDSLLGQHILLVDDVLTTGSTAAEIASVLKKAGAARVTLAVIARAVRR